jgi:hypothetical protein
LGKFKIRRRRGDKLGQSHGPAPENSHGRKITLGGKFHDRRGE